MEWGGGCGYGLPLLWTQGSTSDIDLCETYFLTQHVWLGLRQWERLFIRSHPYMFSLDLWTPQETT